MGGFQNKSSLHPYCGDYIPVVKCSFVHFVYFIEVVALWSKYFLVNNIYRFKCLYYILIYSRLTKCFKYWGSKNGLCIDAVFQKTWRNLHLVHFQKKIDEHIFDKSLNTVHWSSLSYWLVVYQKYCLDTDLWKYHYCIDRNLYHGFSIANLW